MRYGKFMLLGLAALGALACDDDSGVTPPREIPPAALIRFINAGPDTGTVDFRFVDHVENLPTFLGVPFRGASGAYQRLERVGTRPVRVFVNSNNIELASTVLVDESITLEANRRYTIVYAGRASEGQDELVVLEDPFELPTPAEGNIAVRALHVAVGMGPVDVGIRASTDTAVTVARIEGVAYLRQSAYTTLPVLSGTALYRFDVEEAGTGARLFSATPNLPGVPAPVGATYGPQPGVRISGSVLTAVIFAGATEDSRAADQGVSTSPTVSLLIDKPLNP